MGGTEQAPGSSDQAIMRRPGRRIDEGEQNAFGRRGFEKLKAAAVDEKAGEKPSARSLSGSKRA